MASNRGFKKIVMKFWLFEIKSNSKTPISNYHKLQELCFKLFKFFFTYSSFTLPSDWVNTIIHQQTMTHFNCDCLSRLWTAWEQSDYNIKHKFKITSDCKSVLHCKPERSENLPLHPWFEKGLDTGQNWAFGARSSRQTCLKSE